MTITYGWMIARQIDNVEKYKEGTDLLYEFLSGENTDAAYNILEIYIQKIRKHKTLDSNEENKIEIITKIFEKKDFSPGLFQLGLVHEFGFGKYIEKNELKAFQYYVRAKKLGHLAARRRILTRTLSNYGINFTPFKQIARLPLALRALSIALKDLHDERINF
jgi:TPR repeat protein